MEGTYGVGRNCPRSIPLLLDAFLQLCQTLGIELEVGIGGGHADVIDKNAELPHSKGMHLLELAHNVINNRIRREEIVAGMDGPDEIHLRGGRSFADIAHHIFAQPSVLLLLRGDSLGIGLPPVFRMIGIGLCTVEIGIHLQTHHEAHEVLLHTLTIGISVITLYKSTLLLVGIVADVDARKSGSARSVEHLFERCQPHERGIGVLAGNGQAGHAVAQGLEPQMMGIVLAADSHRRVDFQIDDAGAVLGGIGIVGLQPMFLEHLPGTLTCGSVNLFVTYQAYITGKGCGAVHGSHRLWNRINGILRG